MPDCKLTSLEKSIVALTLNEASPELNDFDIESLRVISRKFTGAGAYIYFHRDGRRVFSVECDAQLGLSAEVFVPVEEGEICLGCVLNVNRGELDRIEMFTYGNDVWHGDSVKGRLVPYDVD